MNQNQDIARFFENVYNDKGLQGALNTAICKVAPEVVVEIAATQGLKFTAQEVRDAVGGATDRPQLAQAALKTSFWSSIFGGFIGKANTGELSEAEMEAVVGGLLMNNLNVFKDTDGGYGRVFSLVSGPPAFVQVQSAEARDRVNEETVTASAVDIFEEIK